MPSVESTHRRLRKGLADIQETSDNPKPGESFKDFIQRSIRADGRQIDIDEKTLVAAPVKRADPLLPEEFGSEFGSDSEDLLDFGRPKSAPPDLPSEIRKKPSRFAGKPPRVTFADPIDSLGRPRTPPSEGSSEPEGSWLSRFFCCGGGDVSPDLEAASGPITGGWRDWALEMATKPQYQLVGAQEAFGFTDEELAAYQAEKAAGIGAGKGVVGVTLTRAAAALRGLGGAGEATEAASGIFTAEMLGTIGSMLLAILGILLTIAAVVVPIVLSETIWKVQASYGIHSTTVMLSIGSTGTDRWRNNTEVTEGNLGGSVPHIHLWDEAGNKIGLFNGDANGHLEVGDTHNFEVTHDSGRDAEAAYVALSMHENDAICVSQISVSAPNGVTFDWFGDVGYTCGNSQWYYSAVPINTFGYTPRCIYIDADHTGAIKYSALGLHLPDFVATDARTLQQNRNPELLCESTPRFQMYEKFEPDDCHPYFDPALQYDNDTHIDLDVSKVIHAQGNSRNCRVPDHTFLGLRDEVKQTLADRKKEVEDQQAKAMDELRKQHGKDQIDALLDVIKSKSTTGLGQPSSNTTQHKRDTDLLATADSSHAGPGGNATHRASGLPRYHPKHAHHFISSNLQHHSARHLCQSPASFGPDFVSMREKLFCDMGAKKLWPVCDDKKGRVHSCFDHDAGKMRGPPEDPSESKAGDREVPEKKFRGMMVWRTGRAPLLRDLD